VLKASAWGARLLFESGYKAELQIDWLSDISFQEKQRMLQDAKEVHAKKQMSSFCPFGLPSRLWKALLPNPDRRYADLSKQELSHLVDTLHKSVYYIEGQTTNKEEFVTCGGVKLDEVNFKTMESKIVSNLYFAGEVLDIDGVTGGFNFQNAWTTGWIAGESATHEAI
jgi:predicted Rossmann fold flavoprotein